MTHRDPFDGENSDVETGSRSSHPSPDETRAALSTLLTRPALARAPKSSRLLEHVVTAHLDGHAEGLTEAGIARAVFGQSADFNPRANPIVRVNASRLRSLLRGYYDAAGAADRVQIRLAKVGYAPDISYRSGHDQNAQPEARRSNGASEVIEVAPSWMNAARTPAPLDGAPKVPTFARWLQAPASLGATIALMLASLFLSILYTSVVS